jgi:hypothetical protein
MGLWSPDLRDKLFFSEPPAICTAAKITKAQFSSLSFRPDQVELLTTVAQGSSQAQYAKERGVGKGQQQSAAAEILAKAKSAFPSSWPRSASLNYMAEVMTETIDLLGLTPDQMPPSLLPFYEKQKNIIEQTRPDDETETLLHAAIQNGPTLTSLKSIPQEQQPKIPRLIAERLVSLDGKERGETVSALEKFPRAYLVENRNLILKYLFANLYGLRANLNPKIIEEVINDLVKCLARLKPSQKSSESDIWGAVLTESDQLTGHFGTPASRQIFTKFLVDLEAQTGGTLDQAIQKALSPRPV